MTTVASRIGSTIINIVAMACLARLIAPGDFGLLAKVTALTGIVGLVGDMGLSLATIQSKSIDRFQVSAFFCINVLVGLVLAMIVAAVAPLMGWFYADSRVTNIAIVLAGNILVTSLGTQHLALLQREMRFYEIAKIEILSLLGSSVIAVSLSFWLGYWALLSQICFTTLFRTIGVWLCHQFRPSFRLFGTGIRQQLKMGGNLTLSSFTNYLTRNLDNVLIAKYWGDDALAYYSKAYSLLLLPLNQLASPMSKVAVPALSKLQDSTDQYRSFFRKGLDVALTLQIPTTVFAAIAGAEITLTILGSDWAQSIPIFYALVPNLIASATSPATTWVVLSTGQTGRYFKLVIMNSIAIIIGFAIAIPYGAVAMAWTFSVLSCLLRVPAILYVFHTAPVEPMDFFGRLTVPAMNSLLAAMVALGFHYFVNSPYPIVNLGLKGVIFLAAYTALTVQTSAGKILLQQLYPRIKHLLGR